MTLRYLDSAGAYDDIFSDLSWGKFVNQNYTDNWEMEITNEEEAILLVH